MTTYALGRRLVRLQSSAGVVSSSGSGGSSGGLTDVQLRASAVPVSGPLTDAQLRALAVPVSGTFWQATQPVSGPLTDAQLRAVAVPVSGTFWQATQPVSGPLTDVQLRTSAVPVSGPLTDAQLRAAPVPVSGTVAVTGTFWQATQPVSIAATVKAREDSAAMTWTSLKSAAPAANAVQADTGALTAGDYDFDIFLVCSDTVAVGKGLVIEHRNAANGATLNVLGGVSPNNGAISVLLRRFTIATNERIRVIAGTAAGAASSMYISSIGRRLS